MPPESADRRVQVWGLLGVVFLSAVLFGTVHSPSWGVVAIAAAGLVVHWMAFGSKVRQPSSTVVSGLFAAALVLAGLLWLLPVGTSLRGVLQPGVAPTLRQVSTVLGVDRLALAIDPGAALRSVGRGGVVVALGWVAAGVVRNRSRRLRVVAGLVAVCAAVSVLGQVHAALSLSSMYGASGIPSGPLRSGYFAPFVNPNHGGLYCALGLPLIVGIGRRRDPAQNAALAIAGMLCVAGVVVSGSRGAGLAAFVGILFAVGWTVPPLAARALLGLVGTVGAAVIGHVAWLGLEETGRRWLPGDGQQFDGGRLAIWSDAWSAFQAAPAGVGGGGFATAWRMVEMGPRYGDAVHAHNDLLQVLVEQGAAVGIGWWVLASAPPVLATRRLLRLGLGRRRRLLAGLVGAYCTLAVSSLVSFPAHIGALAIVGAVLAGMLVGAAGQEERPVSPAVQQAARGVHALVTGLGLTLTLTAWMAPGPLMPAPTLAALDAQLQERPLWLRGWLTRADHHLAEGDTVAALDDLMVASLVWPSVPWPHVARARLLGRMGRRVEARSAWKRALSLNFPNNDNVDRWILEAVEGSADPAMELFEVIPERADRLRDAGGTAMELGDAMVATLFYERAHQLNPAFGLPLVRLMLDEGLPREAWKTHQALPEATRESCRGRVVAANLALALKKPDAALAAARSAIRACPEGNEQAWMVLVRSRLATGDQTAVEPMVALVQGHPRQYGLRRALVDALLAAHDYNAAMTHIQVLVTTGVATERERTLLERLDRGLPVLPRR